MEAILSTEEGQVVAERLKEEIVGEVSQAGLIVRVTHTHCYAHVHVL